MMAMRLSSSGKRCGEFCFAATLLSVPIIMGAGLSVDYGRIAHARSAAASALEAAVSAAFHPDGQIDTGLAREIYATSLDLPHGQSSTMPVFSRGADGALRAVVTTATRLTLGGIILPKTFYSAVTYTVGESNRF
jgi:Flp pilus assembly protein TadG